MEQNKVLLVYCTRTGLTEKIADCISENIGCETVKITDGKDFGGVFGFIRAAVWGLKKKLPLLLNYETKLPIEEYESVIVAAPVWSENVCPIARAFLKEQGKRIKGNVYFVITHMSDIDYMKKIDLLDKYLNKPKSGVLSIKTKGEIDFSKVKDFSDKI